MTRTGPANCAPWQEIFGDWRSRIRTWCRCSSPGPSSLHEASGPLGCCDRSKTCFSLLTSAGFAGEDALHIYRVLFGYLNGHILNELQEVVERPEEIDDVLRLGLHRLAITEFPQLRALAPVLASYDGAAELDRFLNLLLPGISATLAISHHGP